MLSAQELDAVRQFVAMVGGLVNLLEAADISSPHMEEVQESMDHVASATSACRDLLDKAAKDHAEATN